MLGIFRLRKADEIFSNACERNKALPKALNVFTIQPMDTKHRTGQGAAWVTQFARLCLLWMVLLGMSRGGRCLSRQGRFSSKMQRWKWNLSSDISLISDFPNMLAVLCCI
jgi:hypothetical protein